jgi:hypothetical protein
MSKLPALALPVACKNGCLGMTKTPHSKKEIELVPDAWPRFERFIKQIAKAGPQHREKADKPTKKREASKPTSRPRSRQKINKDR